MLDAKKLNAYVEYESFELTRKIFEKFSKGDNWINGLIICFITHTWVETYSKVEFVVVLDCMEVKTRERTAWLPCFVNATIFPLKTF